MLRERVNQWGSAKSRTQCVAFDPLVPASRAAEV